MNIHYATCNQDIYYATRDQSEKVLECAKKIIANSMRSLKLPGGQSAMNELKEILHDECEMKVN